MKPKCRFTHFAGPLLLAASALAAINPRVAFRVSIPNAGPMVFDGTYMWVASSDLITAVDPATGAVVASQPIPGTKFIEYDASSGTLWLEGGSINAQLNKVSAQQIIANNGSAPVDSIAFSFGLPTALALDSSSSGRNAWAVSGGAITIIQMDTLHVVNTISTPDGFPVTQIDAAPGLGGMMVTTSGLVGARHVANVWFYGSTGLWISEGPQEPGILTAGAWAAPLSAQFWGDAGNGSVYIYTDTDGSGNAVRSTLHLTDAADSAAAHIGGITGLAVSAAGSLVLAVRQEVDVPNQVYFAGANRGTGAYEVPGLTVPGAVCAAFGGGLAWASSPGPSGAVTAMAY